MRPRTGISLLVVGAIVLAAGWYFGPAQLPAASQSVYAGKLMFPGLASQLQNAAEVQVVHQGQTTVIRKNGAVWGLADRGGYPVEPAKLRGMLTALTELRLVEPRTSDPSEYARLGLRDPALKTATSNLLRVVDAQGKPIAELIVGHRRVLTEGNVPDEVFVRRPGEAQTWLAQGSLTVDADPQLWLRRDILNIDHSRIADLTVQRDGATLAFKAKDGKLAMTQPAQHNPLDNYKLDDLARGLELLSCEDVQPTAPTAADAIGQSVFTTTNGLAVTVKLFKGGKDVLARFEVAGDGAAKHEAGTLNARISPWTYRIGAWKETALVPSLSELETKPAEKTAPTAGATQ